MSKWLNVDKSELHKAAALGLKSDIKFFLDIDFEVDSLDTRGWTPLHYACEAGRKEAVSILLKRGANPRLKTPDHETTLHLAAKAGCPLIIKILHQMNVSFNVRNLLGRTPLHEAAAFGKDSAIRTLLALGSPVSIASFEEYTPLHLAALGGHVAAAKELLEAGALVDDGLVTPLHLAAERGHTEIIKALVEKGADITMTTRNGDTPLHLALLKGHKEAAEVLVRLGAKVEANGYLNSKPLHYAVLCQPKVVSWLLSLGAHPNPIDGDGATPMTWAAAHHRELARTLLKRRGGEEPPLKSKSIGYPPKHEGTTVTEKMSKTIWRNGPAEEAVSSEAVRTLDQLGEAMDEFVSRSKTFRGNNGLIDAALNHWESNGRELTPTINTISGQEILETFFSFQPDNVQVFINLEGAFPEDIELKVLSDEGGFDLSVRHREAHCLKDKRQYAHREVIRSYRFVRPLAWEKAEYVIRPDGILHMMVPGPSLTCQPLPFQNVVSSHGRCDPCSVKPHLYCG